MQERIEQLERELEEIKRAEPETQAATTGQRGETTEEENPWWPLPFRLKSK